MSKLIPGKNDLATTHPELATEWHPTKNGELKPEQVTSGSNKKVWWQCKKCGHEWQAPICNRSQGSTCPVCAYRVRIEKRLQTIYKDRHNPQEMVPRWRAEHPEGKPKDCIQATGLSQWSVYKWWNK